MKDPRTANGRLFHDLVRWEQAMRRYELTPVELSDDDVERLNDFGSHTLAVTATRRREEARIRKAARPDPQPDAPPSDDRRGGGLSYKMADQVLEVMSTAVKRTMKHVKKLRDEDRKEHEAQQAALTAKTVEQHDALLELIASLEARVQTLEECVIKKPEVRP